MRYYFVEAWNDYAVRGGTSDIQGVFETINEARDFAKQFKGNTGLDSMSNCDFVGIMGFDGKDFTLIEEIKG